jgi:branched-chain amino acid transport system substrate-binding protein
MGSSVEATVKETFTSICGRTFGGQWSVVVAALLSAVVFFLMIITPVCAAPVRVGVIAPLSGGLADYGTALRNGFALAEQDAAKDKSKIEFLFEDSQYDGKRTLAAFNKLVESDRCVAVFVWGSGPSEALAPVAERKRVSLFTLGEHTAAVGRPHVINFTNPAIQLSSLLARYLRAEGRRKLALVMTDITYFQSLASTLRMSLSDDQHLTTIDTYLPSDNDFRSTISKLRAGHFDSLGVFLLPGQVSQFYKQMRQQNLSLSTFGSDIFESSQEIRDAGSAIEGAVYVHHGVSEDFRHAYVAAFERDLHLPTAARGYDFARMVFQVSDSAASEQGKHLLSKLEQLSPYHGVSGAARFVNDPQYGKRFEFPVVVKQIRGGKSVVIAESK